MSPLTIMGLVTNGHNPSSLLPYTFVEGQVYHAIIHNQVNQVNQIVITLSSTIVSSVPPELVEADAAEVDAVADVVAVVVADEIEELTAFPSGAVTPTKSVSPAVVLRLSK